MIRLTVRQMEYFDALARTLHFGRAAEMAGVSQPALSTQIAEMEERLGCTLFERGGKAVRLTDEALTLQPRVERLLSELRDIERVARQGRTAMEGRFRLGIIPTVAGVAPYVGLNFMIYESVRQYFTPEGASAPSPIGKLSAGAISGAVAQTCTYPLDVLRRRFQIKKINSLCIKFWLNRWSRRRWMNRHSSPAGLRKGRQSKVSEPSFNCSATYYEHSPSSLVCIPGRSYRHSNVLFPPTSTFLRRQNLGESSTKSYASFSSLPNSVSRFATTPIACSIVFKASLRRSPASDDTPSESSL